MKPLVNRLRFIWPAMYFGKTDLGFKFICNIAHIGINLQLSKCILVWKPSVKYTCEYHLLKKSYAMKQLFNASPIALGQPMASDNRIR